MAVGVNQPREQHSLPKVDNIARATCFDLAKFANVDNSISGDHDRAVFNGRTIHRDNRPRTNDHSLFTIFRHSAMSRLHASWQSSGTVAGVAAVAGVLDPGGVEAVP